MENKLSPVYSYNFDKKIQVARVGKDSFLYRNFNRSSFVIFILEVELVIICS